MNIPRDIVNLLINEICVSANKRNHGASCFHAYRASQFNLNTAVRPFRESGMAINLCTCQKSIVTGILKNLRVVCWKFSSVITVKMLLTGAWSNMSFRSSHLSWLIRANSTFAAVDLQTLQARADWARIIHSHVGRFELEYNFKVKHWLWRCVDIVDSNPRIIYRSDFGPPNKCEHLELVQARINRRWWLDHHDGGYRPFSERCKLCRGSSAGTMAGTAGHWAMVGVHAYNNIPAMDFSTLYPSRMMYPTIDSVDARIARRMYRAASHERIVATVPTIGRASAALGHNTRNYVSAYTTSTYNTGDYYPIPYNTGDYYPIPYNTGDYDTIPYNTGDYDTIPYHTTYNVLVGFCHLSQHSRPSHVKKKSARSTITVPKKYKKMHKIPRQKYQNGTPGRHKLRHR